MSDQPQTPPTAKPLAPASGSALLPCPFCGGVEIAPAPRYSFPVATRCNTCGATGPQKLTGREADRDWNLRAAVLPPNGKVSR